MNTKPTLWGLLASLGLIASATSHSSACGGPSFSWMDPVTEAMDLFVELAMTEETTLFNEEADPVKRPTTTKRQGDHIISDLSISVSPLSSGTPSVALRWTAVEGRHYTVERSSGLDSWSVLTDSHAGSTGFTTFTDKDSASRSSFYRVTAN